MQNYLSQFFELITKGSNGKTATSVLIFNRLEELMKHVIHLENQTNEWKGRIYVNVKPIEIDIINDALNQFEFYPQFHNMRLHVKTLLDSFEDVDIEEENSILAFKEVVKKELVQLFDGTSFFGDNFELSKVVDKIFDVVLHFLFHKTENRNAVEELIQDILSVLDELKFFKGNTPFREIIGKYLHFVFDIGSILAMSVRPIINNRYADKQAVYNYIRPSLHQVEDILKQADIFSKSETKNISLDSLWEAGHEFVSISEYDEIQELLDKSRKGVERIFAVLNQTVVDNVELVKILNNIKETIIHWLTLDDEDFRVENIIELLHFVIRRIQETLLEYKNALGNKWNGLHDFLIKLNIVLDYIDNKDFKLLITPKEDVEMHHIALPDLLPTEPQEKEQDKALPSSDHDTWTTHHASTDAADRTDSPPEKLTMDKVIDFLCFDKQHGATAKMDTLLADVIHDLYYRDWLAYRLEHLENEIMSVFTIEKYQPIWEDIKTKLLDENGVNLGVFLTFLIDKVVTLINDLIAFVKDTVQYIIDEIFNLPKAIIQFFERVDLPPAARDFIKTIPLFKDMPDHVTILHVIAAIPYTLFNEFINFEVPHSSPQSVAV